VRADLRELERHELFLPEEPRDEADEAERVQGREMRTTLDERSARLAQAIEAALDRIARKRYGRCVDCGRTIERARLELVPWTLRCADDQEQVEAFERAHAPTL
jgi:RNA polymerase-binding transcription factor DksA